MSLKFKLFVCFFAALAVQGAQSSPVVEDAIQRGIIDQIFDLIKTIRESIESLVKGALEQFDKHMRWMLDVVFGILGEATDYFENIIGVILAPIEKLINEAFQLGIDISDCVDNIHDSVRKIFDDALADIKTCLDNQVNIVSNLFQRVRDDVDGYFKQLAALEQEARNCKGITGPICLADVLARVTAASIKFPLAITDSITKTLREAVDLTNNLYHCSVDITAAATERATKYVADVTKCILDQIFKEEEKLQEKIENALKDLESKIKDAIDNGTKLLEDLMKELETVGETVGKAIQDQVDKWIAEAKNHFDELKEKAKELGIDISKCTDGKEAEIKAIADEYFTNAKTCIKNDLDKANAVFTDAGQSIKDAFNNIPNFQEEAKKCGNGTQAIVCLSKIAVDVAAAVVKVPLDIGDTVTTATGKIVDIKAELYKCNVDAANESSKKIAVVMDEVNKCFAALIEEKIAELKDSVNKEYEKLKEALEVALDNAKKNIEDTYNNMVKFVDEIKTGAKNKWDEIVAAFESDVQKWKDAAEKAGVDISECLKGYNDALSQLGSDLMDEVAKCIDDDLANAKTIMDTSVENIVNGFTLPNIKEQILACGDGTDGAICISKVLADTGALVAKMPLDIADEAVAASKLIIDVQSAMLNCGVDAVAAYEKKSDQVHAEVQECVDYKMSQGGGN